MYQHANGTPLLHKHIAQEVKKDELEKYKNKHNAELQRTDLGTKATG